MATAQDLSALFKEVYGDKLESLIPESSVLLKKIPFRKSEKLGDKFIQPVLLSSEQGFTYNSDGTAFSLNDAVTAVMKEAQVDGSELLLRTSISYRHAAKAAEGKGAFANWTKLVVKNMLDSISKRLEVGMLYGQSGIGTIDGDPGTGPGAREVDITSASWAAGIWAGSEGASLDVYNAVGDTKRNSNAAVIIDSVDLDGEKITVSGNEDDLDAIADTDVFYFRGSKAAEMSGVDKIITNTGSLHNIDASTYALWKGNSHAVDGNLTAAHVLKGVGKAVAKSGLSDNVIICCNPRAFETMNSASSRTFDSSYKASKAESGSESIVFHGQNGVIEVVPNLYCKQGDAFAFSPKHMKRVGSSDVTFTLPGKPSEEIFLQLASNAGYELRCYSDQGLMGERPSSMVKFTGITV